MVIDIGSNSVRVMYGSDAERLNEKLIDTTQLAQGLDGSGKLSEEAMARTVEAISRFVIQGKARGEKTLYIFATEAVRSSSNGGEFCRLVKAATGAEVDVLGGEEEAEIGFFGAAGNTCISTAVLDVGGASVELVVGSGGSIRYAKSLPIGLVRLRERANGDFARAAELLPALMDGFGLVPSFDKLIAIGGTATTLVALRDNLQIYSAAEVDGKTLTAEDVAEQCRQLSQISAAQLVEKYPVMNFRRAEVVPYGAALVKTLMKHFGLNIITVSERDNMEGYLIKKRGKPLRCPI